MGHDSQQCSGSHTLKQMQTPCTLQEKVHRKLPKLSLCIKIVKLLYTDTKVVHLVMTGFPENIVGQRSETGIAIDKAAIM